MNKHSKFWTVSFAILVLVGGVLFWINQRSFQLWRTTIFSLPKLSKKPKAETHAEPSLPSDRRESESESTLAQAESALTVTRIVQPPTVTEPSSVVKLQGIGETAVLFASDGKRLLQATPTNPIYSIKPSPSGRQAVVSRGNGINELYNFQPFGFIRKLPLTPDIPRASAFEPWGWIDESTLIAVVDVERKPSELVHLTAIQRESATNWREQTLLYSFSLADVKLTRIETIKAGLPPSFTVVEMRSGGFLKIEWDENEVTQTFWVAIRGK